MIMSDRVQRRMDDLELNPFAAARKAGLEAGYVRDILRGKVKEPGAAKLSALATVLKCSPDYLLGLVEKPGRAPGDPIKGALTAVVEMPIRYEVAAGLWREVDDVRDIPLGSQLTALAPEYAAFDQWLERLRGDSMDRVLPDGALLHVIDAIAMGYSPAPGDFVIAQRTRAQGALIERTVKQVAITAKGEIELWPRSYNPRWDKPVAYLEGTVEDDVEIRIVGKVVKAYISF